MRISTKAGDLGRQQFDVACAHGKVPKIYLDGVEQMNVVTADEEKGFIERYVLTVDGKAQVDPDDPSQIWTEKVRGRVEVKFDGAVL